MIDQVHNDKLIHGAVTASDIPIPRHFADCIELQSFVDTTGCAYHWQGTQGFTNKQNQYGDRFIVVPVWTRRGITMVGLLPPELVKLERETAAKPKPSIVTQRMLAATVALPDENVGSFTPAETAVLAVVRDNANSIAGLKRPVCVLPRAEIASRASVGLTTMRRAISKAEELGLLEVVAVNGPEDGIRNWCVGQWTGSGQVVWPR
jgi:hypothetical protein